MIKALGSRNSNYDAQIKVKSNFNKEKYLCSLKHKTKAKTTTIWEIPSLSIKILKASIQDRRLESNEF